MTNPPAARSARSSGQPLVEVVHDLRQIFSEHSVNPTQTAEPLQLTILEVVLLNAKGGGDVVLYGVEPLSLLGGEAGPCCFLFGEPVLVPFLDRCGVGFQGLAGVYGVLDE